MKKNFKVLDKSVKKCLIFFYFGTETHFEKCYRSFLKAFFTIRLR